jgi:energy-coupling factor transport system permease protein
MYVARASGLHSLSPITKFTLTLSLLLSSLALPGQWTSYAVLLGVVLPLALWGQVALHLVRTVWKISWPFVLSVILIQTLLWGKGEVLLQAGPLKVYEQGLLFSLSSIGRILLVMSLFLLFAITTRPDLLMISLKQVGLPGSIAYIIVTTLQIVPRFQARANTILDAQRSRGLETEGSMLKRARALVPLVAPLVLSSLVEVEERAIAIEARGFNSGHAETSLIEIEDSPRQALVRRALWILTGLVVAGRIVWEAVR